MRQSKLAKHLTPLAMALVTSVSLLVASPVSAQGTDDNARAFSPSQVNSFAGAFLAGRTADMDSDIDAAIDFYRIALEFEPENNEVKQRLMISLLINGQFDEGAVLAEELKDDPLVDRITSVALGVQAIGKREFRQAEQHLFYDGPNELDQLLNGLLAGWARFGQGKADEAIADIDAMTGPPWYDIFQAFHTGAIAAAAGNKELARERLGALIDNVQGGGTSPDTYVRAVMLLAEMEARAGEKARALQIVSDGDNFTPGYAPLTALRQAIMADEVDGSQIANASDGAASVLYTIASALNRPGAEEIVSLYLQLSRALNSEDAGTLVLLGELAESLGKTQKAIDIYRSVPATSPMHRISEMQLGLQLAALGETDEAKSHLSALIDKDPLDMRSYVALGRVLSGAQDYRAMANNYDRAAKVLGAGVQPRDWNIYFQRAIAYERLKEWETAEPYFRRALELSPDQPQVLNYLGYSWIDMNINLDEGVEMIRKAVELRPNDGYIVDSLGWAHYRLGDFEDAARELERAVTLRPHDPTINDHLGDAYWKVGRKLEAVFQWNRALANDPDEELIPVLEDKIANGMPQSNMEDAVGLPAKATTPSDDAAVVLKDEKTEAPADQVLPVEPASYVVKPGQTLWRIADETLGDGNLYPALLEANPGLQGDPHRIFPGQRLTVPGMGR